MYEYYTKKFVQRINNFPLLKTKIKSFALTILPPRFEKMHYFMRKKKSSEIGNTCKAPRSSGKILREYLSWPIKGFYDF